jgi:hemerythrin
MDIGWDPSLETGNVDIDRQHRQLLEIVDRLETVEAESHGSREAILLVLSEITDFAGSHFAMEQDLMREVDYPPVPTIEMIEQHQDFKAYARLRVLEFRSGDLLSVKPLRTFLTDWLTIHEFGLDRALADFIRDRAQG